MNATQNRPTRPKSVIVVGGGLIGLFSAYYLQKEGLQVTLVDSGSPTGSSRGSAGEIVPTLVAPLSTPGILRESVGSVLKPDSALFLHPRISPEMARFLFRFIRNTRSTTFQKSFAELQEFAGDAFALYDALESDGFHLDRNTDGFLFVYQTLAAAKKAAAYQARMTGATSELMSGSDLRAIEPNLSNKVGSGFMLTDQWSIDPGALVDQLLRTLADRGVEFVTGAVANRVRETNGRVHVDTAGGSYSADVCVLAAGVWTRELSRGLGIDLDIVTGKGYSFNVDLPHAVSRTIQFADVHVVATPMGDQVRIAGTMELDKRQELFNPRRVKSIVAAASPYLSEDVNWAARRNEWVGARPMTGDGMPIIGRLPGHERVAVAAGHGMHGLTLGPVTGRLVSRLFTDPQSSAESNPFDPSRNGRARRWNRPSSAR